MSKLLIAFTVFFNLLCSIWCSLNVSQVHIAWAGNGVTSFAFSFVTDAPYASQISTILYGTSPNSLTMQKTGYNYPYGSGDHIIRIHNLIVSNLKPDTQYYYRVGDSKSNSWSDILTFTTKSQNLRYAVYGDFGATNDRAIDQLTEEVGKLYNAVIHVGDFAYDLDEDNGRVGDEFMNVIEPIASQVPYMTCVGNHEAPGNFSQYQNRFSLVRDGVGRSSGSDTNLWYSFDEGLIHWIAIDTEVYVYSVDQGQIQRQMNWLEQDLVKANQNRQNVPWIIMFGHKGWFMDTNYTGFEYLAHKYGVDVFLCGHIHNYERFYPQHNSVVDVQSPNFYKNPKYMTTIIVGSPGCKENITHELGPKPALVYSSYDYGYGHLFVANYTHLSWDWEEVSPEKITASIKDTLWIYQSHHGPRLWE